MERLILPYQEAEIYLEGILFPFHLWIFENS